FLIDIKIFIYWALFVVFLIVETLVLAYLGHDMSSIFSGYLSYYAMIFVLGPFLFAEFSITDRTALNSILAIFVPIGILGILQFIMYDTIVPKVFVDGRFSVAQNRFFGDHGRSMSIFVSIAYFGHFIALIVGFVTATLVKIRG